MTDQHWDTWIDWDNAVYAGAQRIEPSNQVVSLAPGSINHAYDSRFWVTEELPTWVHAGTVYHSDPYNRGILLRSRFVLPILGCGNDPW